MKVTFTSEELKRVIKQPEDSCPFFNNSLELINKKIKDNENNKSEAFLKNIKHSMNEAFLVIDDISKWATSWEKLYEDNKSLSANDSFVKAYVQEAHKNKKNVSNFNLNEKFEIFKEKIDFFIDDIDSDNIKNELNQISKEENETNRIMIDINRKILFEGIEDFRDFAKNQRGIGEFFKKAYKEISLINDFNDIIQPYELIEEEQKKENSFILGVLDHEKTFEQLEKLNIINEYDEIILTKMSFEKKKNFIIKKIKESNPEVSNIFYFDNIDSFIDNKGYSKEKVKIKNNLTNKR